MTTFFESLTVISVEHYCKSNMFEMINSWKHTEFRKVIKKLSNVISYIALIKKLKNYTTYYILSRVTCNM